MRENKPRPPRPYPSAISDEEWAFVAPYLTLIREDAPQRTFELRTMVDAWRWMVRTGAPWRYLPGDFPPCEAVYERFARWTDDGTWVRVLQALLAEAPRRGKIDWRLWCVDGTSIRALKAAAGARGKNLADTRRGAPARARRPPSGAFARWVGQETARRL